MFFEETCFLTCSLSLVLQWLRSLTHHNSRIVQLRLEHLLTLMHTLLSFKLRFCDKLEVMRHLEPTINVVCLDLIWQSELRHCRRLLVDITQVAPLGQVELTTEIYFVCGFVVVDCLVDGCHAALVLHQWLQTLGVLPCWRCYF